MDPNTSDPVWEVQRAPSAPSCRWSDDVAAAWNGRCWSQPHAPPLGTVAVVAALAPVALVACSVEPEPDEGTEAPPPPASASTCARPRRPAERDARGERDERIAHEEVERPSWTYRPNRRFGSSKEERHDDP